MKLHIFYDFKDGPYGGGNQFLKALQSQLKYTSNLAVTPKEADAILFNLNPGMIPTLLKTLPHLRRQNPSTPFAMRLDGPISLIRNQSPTIDRYLSQLIKLWANGLIFQSQWSKDQNQALGINHPHSTIIHNAPDPNIFFPTKTKSQSSKTRLIATSWSANPGKGFNIYQYLDQHLNWNKYQMTFVGNSPISFKNIKQIPPQSSQNLANILQQQDLFITASRNDPCSNSLLEALACGLPAIIRDSGGHRELAGKSAVTFTNTENVISAITTATNQLQQLHQNIPSHTIGNVANKYINFVHSLKTTSSNHTSDQLSTHILQVRYTTWLLFKHLT